MHRDTKAKVQPLRHFLPYLPDSWFNASFFRSVTSLGRVVWTCFAIWDAVDGVRFQTVQHSGVRQHDSKCQLVSRNTFERCRQYQILPCVSCFANAEVVSITPLALNVFRTASAGNSAFLQALGLVNDCELFDFQESLLIWRSLVSMSCPFLAVMKSVVEAAGKLKMVSILQPDKWRTMRNSLCDKATELVTGYEASAVLLNCSEFGASLFDAQQDTVVDSKQKTVAGVYLNAIEHHTNKCMSLADFCNVVKKTYCCNLQDL